MMGKWTRRLQRARAWSWRLKLGLLLTWLLLGLGRLAVLCLPFPRIAARLGRHAGPLLYVPLVAPAQHARLQRLAWMITLAARYAPWQANCFAQAIAARCWLGWLRLPGAVFFGVRKDEHGKLHAHAWVQAGPVSLSGGDSFATFTVVATFLYRVPALPGSAS